MGGLERSENTKFPVFSLLIREFTLEIGSHQTASSATQSSMSDILCGACRKSAHTGLICISCGTRDSQTAGELPLADLLPLISRRWFLVTSVVKVLRW
jgi:hypothetical protein